MWNKQTPRDVNKRNFRAVNFYSTEKRNIKGQSRCYQLHSFQLLYNRLLIRIQKGKEENNNCTELQSSSPSITQPSAQTKLCQTWNQFWSSFLLLVFHLSLITAKHHSDNNKQNSNRALSPPKLFETSSSWSLSFARLGSVANSQLHHKTYLEKKKVFAPDKTSAMSSR